MIEFVAEICEDERELDASLIYTLRQTPAVRSNLSFMDSSLDFSVLVELPHIQYKKLPASLRDIFD
jgi:hypothetical protein